MAPCDWLLSLSIVFLRFTQYISVLHLLGLSNSYHYELWICIIFSSADRHTGYLLTIVHNALVNIYAHVFLLICPFISLRYTQGIRGCSWQSHGKF